MQLVEILIYSNKIKTVDDLLNHFDLIIELARDDILKITKSKRLLFSDFDFTFGEAIKILINQLQKKYLKGNRFELFMFFPIFYTIATKNLLLRFDFLCSYDANIIIIV